MERRDFLKYFGIGTAIVPLVGGIVQHSATAKLIEVPKIELVTSEIASHNQLRHLLTIFTEREECTMQLTLSRRDGRSCSYTCTSAHASDIKITEPVLGIAKVDLGLLLHKY